MSGLQERLQPGWPTAALAVVLFGVAAIATAITAENLQALVTRAAIAGFVIALVGLVIGMEGLISVATIPMFGAALAGVAPGSGPAWGRSLILGCLWYIGLEVAWWSIEQRSNATGAAAVTRQRAQEVATVIIITVAVGLIAAASASMAPDRTLVIRGLLALTLLAAFFGAVRHLIATGPPAATATVDQRPTRIRARDRRAG